MSEREIPGMEEFITELRNREISDAPLSLKERQEKSPDISKLTLKELETEVLGELKYIYDHDVSRTEAQSLDQYTIETEAATMADIIEAVYGSRIHDVVTILRHYKTMVPPKRHIIEKTADILEDNLGKKIAA